MIRTKLENKTILITGVAGFIGAELAKNLILIDNVKIIGIDNMNDYYDVSLKEYRIKDLIKNKNFFFIIDSIDNRKSVEDIFQKYRPDIVVNLAAQAGVRYSIENSESYIKSNIIGFYNILEACKEYKVDHLIFASSSSVYGNNKNVPYSTEDNTDKPVSLYAATKKSNELMAYSYSKIYNIPITGLRFFTVYGPAGRPDMAYFKFTNNIVNNKKIEIFNYGKCQRDFTFIDDIVKGITLVMQYPPIILSSKIDERVPYSIYNIGNNKPEELMDFINILEEELVRVNLLPKDYDFKSNKKLVAMQPGDVVTTYADTSKLEKDFSFKPSTPLRKGLREFVEWYKDFYNK